MSHNLKLTNSLTRKKELFKPINPKSVMMYACGPTVYDSPHVGNARALVVFDLLFRILIELYGKQNVTYIRNITDIDDKIIEASKNKKITISDFTDAAGGGTLESTAGEIMSMIGMSITDNEKANEFFDMIEAHAKNNKDTIISELVDTESLALMNDDVNLIDEMLLSNSSIDMIAESLSKKLISSEQTLNSSISSEKTLILLKYVPS